MSVFQIKIGHNVSKIWFFRSKLVIMCQKIGFSGPTLSKLECCRSKIDIVILIYGNLLGTLHTDMEELFNFAKLGSYLEFDLFGIECSHYQLCEKIDFLSDAQRVDVLLQLINEGYEDRIIVSHDIHTKHRLVSSIDPFQT